MAMTGMMTFEAIATIIKARSWGTPTAVKRGRNPAFPFVPVVDHGEQWQGVHRTRTEQILGKAFATRPEAVEYATRIIEARKVLLAKTLMEPRMRALRKAHGLPEEVAK
jgi:hypothetical protein